MPSRTVPVGSSVGLHARPAAVIGAKEVGWTLLSMNLALVAVFISILFMGGIVERLFRICRDKLLTIGWFAWGYRLVTNRLDRIRALPAWQAVVRAVNHIKEKAREAIRWIRSAA